MGWLRDNVRKGWESRGLKDKPRVGYYVLYSDGGNVLHVRRLDLESVCETVCVATHGYRKYYWGSRDYVILALGAARKSGDGNATYTRHGSQPTMVTRHVSQPNMA